MAAGTCAQAGVPPYLCARDAPVAVPFVHAVIPCRLCVREHVTREAVCRVWASLGSVVSSVIRQVVGETESPGT